MFGVKKEEYERVVQASNELRVKLEKMRLENVLLKEQIRAILNLPPELSAIYVVVQSRGNATVDEIKKDKKISSLNTKKIKASIKKLMELGLLESIGDEERYTVRTPDASGGMISKGDDSVTPAIVPEVKKEDEELDFLGNPKNV